MFQSVENFLFPFLIFTRKIQLNLFMDGISHARTFIDIKTHNIMYVVKYFYNPPSVQFINGGVILHKTLH